ncbi:MAG: class I SAM-dependent methyltransferase [Planctomycetota bacterium]
MDKNLLDKYNSEEGALSYVAEYDDKLHRKLSNVAEVRILERLMKSVGQVDSLLDIPSGFGRFRDLFRGHARQVVEGDWSLEMLRVNRSQAETPDEVGFVRADARSLPFADDSIDCVVSIRLSHHIPDRSQRYKHFDELLRVARRFVVATYFDEYSFKNLLRELRRPFNNKRSKWTLKTSEVRSLGRARGFELVESVPIFRLSSGHRYALLRSGK